MCLWGEHMGCSGSQFVYPGSKQCVDTVNNIANRNWELFAGNEVREMDCGHIMRYPYRIDSSGNVTAVQPFFPDTTAPICGVLSTLIPSHITM